ncbi:PPE family protein [Mycobacterium tuberculosis]|uniref:PPE family protein n=3 Tax=Mycobacterium tuberculosis TaxID=1773 RepID=UPI00045AE67C|nr:PPE family protein [Mycobacterium tuberculosis]KCP41851.1 PPE family protein PPE59 [Mycobacterium tuberculosis BTB09-382]KCS25087.1 PPE family protein PPE59 [Mycobacterium tuberculosis XTB13-091]KCT82055.1 PPE family protein PPE59 [Mycobacterium tuberculosis XTB13-140]KCU41582.1 PPE family protein PPE59 [Mycobacterium tuberculosis XTB13-161]KCU84281.1 PPE family protein PPE59 [Mycobacterium tuberculosis XTB13-179]
MHPMIPAEYISNIIYEGPGADSLFFASGQLRELAYSVETTAESLEDELDELDENWKGSSSDLMADAAGRYLDWLTKHSRQILETAYVIDFLAYVYEETRHKVVPPATIANNREEVHRLIASNVAGVNTPAIAGLDAQYQQYRAQNIAVMNDYQSTARFILAYLPRWQEPPQIYGGGGG